MRRSAAVRVGLSLLGGLWCWASPAWASSYKITDLDGPDGWFFPPSQRSLNNRGQVAGEWNQENPSDPSVVGRLMPYFYDPTRGGKVTLPAIISPSGDDPGGYNALYFRRGFTGVDESGRAVTNSRDGAMRFDPATGGFTPVAGPAGFQSNSGAIIGTKDAGQVDGWGNFVPVSYQDGREKPLGLPPGAVGAEVQSINDVGDVLIRAAMSPGAFEHFFVLTASGTWRDLGDASGAAINDHGVVAGGIGGDTLGHPSHAALTSPDGITTDIGTLPGDWYAFADGINNRGEAVGLSYMKDLTSTLMYHGFLYKDGKMIDLNDLVDPASGWSIHWGMAINDLGQILASAIRNDRASIVLLTPDDMPTPPDPVFPDMPETPVPEPSTLLVFAGLALGVGLARRRRT